MDQKVQKSSYTTQMLEEIPVGIALLDVRDFHVITANRCFRTLFAFHVHVGKEGTKTAGKWDQRNPFDAPGFPFGLELFETLKQTGKVYQEQEFSVLHPERGMTYWNGSITPIYNTQGQLNQFLITASDVTDQTKARLLAEGQQNEQQKSAALAHSHLLDEVELERERLRAVLDHLPEGVLLVEADKRFVSYANEAAAHILAEPREELLGMSLEHIYALSQHHFSLKHKGSDINKAHIPLLRALAGETTVGKETQFTRPNGKIITLLVATAPIWNKAGIITGAVSIFQDITVRKSIEQQKNDFFSIASHELRTPTTAIQGFAEILQMFTEQEYEPGTPHTLQIIANILEQSTRLASLINEMLDISRIEHEQMVLHTAPHDLATTVRRAVANMAVTDREHLITLHFQGIAPDESLIGFFDEERILQVLNNFISNAIKYSQAGSNIEVGLCYTQTRPEKVRLWVSDSGIGIPSDDLPHIFERFHRAENVDRSISGLGIGLYLAREIILRHGGSIWAESQEGIGSTFLVELLLHPPEQATNLAHLAQSEGEP